jgi:hypothetical protein
MSKIEKTSSPQPQKIVGIYLTELGYVMAKVQLSNLAHLNIKIADVSQLLPPELADVPIDLRDWRFIPCCE